MRNEKTKKAVTSLLSKEPSRNILYTSPYASFEVINPVEKVALEN